jgi:GNAT superfamily N-acetyltransferase
VRIYRATEADVSLLLEIRRESIDWLATRNTDQWASDFPDEGTMLAGFAADARNGHAWLIDDDDVTVATVTLDAAAQPVIWTSEEAAEPARYVHRLTVRRKAAGLGLGGELLDWCGNRAYEEGARWLRLDAWTTNHALHDYYRSQGFEHLRTADRADYPSGALFQRPARPATTPRLTEI